VKIYLVRVIAPASFPRRKGFCAGFEVIDGEFGRIAPVLEWVKTSSPMTPRAFVYWARHHGWKVTYWRVK
jgi:hypothetical protein